MNIFIKKTSISLRNNRMKSLVTAVGFACVVFVVSGCSSVVERKAQRSQGLIDFLFALDGGPDKDALPVESVSSESGEIASAHVDAVKNGFIVRGYVQRGGPSSPPYGSHIDVFLVNKSGTVIERAVTDYMPRDIPSGSRNPFHHSSYYARLLTTNPPQGATVKVVFDESPGDKI